METGWGACGTQLKAAISRTAKICWGPVPLGILHACRLAERGARREAQKDKSLSPAVSLYRPLLTKANIVPHAEGENAHSCSSSITNWAMKGRRTAEGQ